MRRLDGALERAIEKELAQYDPAALRRATQALSDRYRRQRPSPGVGFIEDDLDAAAYVAYRMPATFAALRSVLDQLRARIPQWEPRTILDVGAGSGAGLWAAIERWPELRHVTLLDVNQTMLTIGRRLCRVAECDALPDADWIVGDLRTASGPAHADLVLAIYTLNELRGDELRDAVSGLWDRALGLVVVVEPGTPDGFRTLKRARQALIDRGAEVIAPCPHSLACPMPEDDWCHFSARLPRSRVHRAVKPGDLSYEDEKFSYVVAARISASPAESRVLRHPSYRRGMVQLTTCGPDGLATRTLTRRKDRQLYRAARKVAWGDEFPAEAR